MQKDGKMRVATTWTIVAFLVAPFAIALVMAFWGLPKSQHDFIAALILIPVFYFFPGCH